MEDRRRARRLRPLLLGNQSHQRRLHPPALGHQYLSKIQKKRESKSTIGCVSVTTCSYMYMFCEVIVNSLLITEVVCRSCLDVVPPRKGRDLHHKKVETSHQLLPHHRLTNGGQVENGRFWIPSSQVQR